MIGKIEKMRNLISAASYKHYDLRLEFHVLNTDNNCSYRLAKIISDN